MYTYQLKHPLEKDGIEFIDIAAPAGGSPDFNKACAALAGQFIYSQGKFVESATGKEMIRENEAEIKAKADEAKEKSKDGNSDEAENVDYFLGAKQTNNLFSVADKDYLVNITNKFSDMYKKNPKILQFNGEPLKQLQFNSLNWYDLSILATAYCTAFMQG